MWKQPLYIIIHCELQYPTGGTRKTWFGWAFFIFLIFNGMKLTKSTCKKKKKKKTWQIHPMKGCLHVSRTPLRTMLQAGLWVPTGLDKAGFPAEWRCCNTDCSDCNLQSQRKTTQTGCLCRACRFICGLHHKWWWRHNHRKKKKQPRLSTVSPAGAPHLPTTGPLCAVSFMSYRWAVVLQAGTKPHTCSRCCFISSEMRRYLSV